MWTVTASSTSAFTDFVASATVAFLPLVATVSGVFIAFAIANMLRHFLYKVVKK